MTSLLVGPLAAPLWPDGIVLRPLAEADKREIHALLLLSYTNGFGEVLPLDEWWQYMTTDSEFDPSLIARVDAVRPWAESTEPVIEAEGDPALEIASITSMFSLSASSSKRSSSTRPSVRTPETSTSSASSPILP